MRVKSRPEQTHRAHATASNNRRRAQRERKPRTAGGDRERSGLHPTLWLTSAFEQMQSSR